MLRPNPSDHRSDSRQDGGRAPHLRLRGVSKRFGDVRALTSLELDIEDGEFFTLLGPSGCGKTTLLRLIGGFEQPSDGIIELDGRDIRREPPERRPFNMVFQNYALFPHMTVAENIAYGLKTARVPGEELRKRVADALELVHLDEMASRNVKTLSGGQQQRVALVRALINEPEILLLDEPLGALDLQLRKRLQTELRAIQARLGTTFIYVTHDQEEAMALSHRIALMRAGELVQLGTPREIYEQPASRFAAEFIGETGLVPCRVQHVWGREVDVRFASGCFAKLQDYGRGDLKAGEDVLAVVRPEHLQIARTDDWHFEARVLSTVFLGSESQHETALPDGTVIRVRADTGDVRGGDVVGVGIRPGSGAVVRAEESAVEPRVTA